MIEEYPVKREDILGFIAKWEKKGNDTAVKSWKRHLKCFDEYMALSDEEKEENDKRELISCNNPVADWISECHKKYM